MSKTFAKLSVMALSLGLLILIRRYWGFEVAVLVALERIWEGTSRK